MIVGMLVSNKKSSQKKGNRHKKR